MILHVTGANCGTRVTTSQSISAKLLDEPFWIGIIVVAGVIVGAGIVVLLKKKCSHFCVSACRQKQPETKEEDKTEEMPRYGK